MISVILFCRSKCLIIKFLCFCIECEKNVKKNPCVVDNFRHVVHLAAITMSFPLRLWRFSGHSLYCTFTLLYEWRHVAYVSGSLLCPMLEEGRDSSTQDSWDHLRWSLSCPSVSVTATTVHDHGAKFIL